jgi:hypothetical protein
LLLPIGVLAQAPRIPRDSLPPAPVLDGAQFGIRFGYQLQFPSKNYVGLQNFSFFEAGHHIGYGGFVNLKLGSKGSQFSPYLGLEHVFWPKSEGYSKACNLDSFPTFMAVRDSLPGRDFRFYNIAFEPAFKFYMRRSGIFIKLQPMLSYNIQRKVEQYNHACGTPLGTQFIDYAPNALRGMSKFTFSLGAGIVKQVQLGKESFLALEPGVKVMLSRLLYVHELNPDGLSFSLVPWGLYLNLSFVR